MLKYLYILFTLCLLFENLSFSQTGNFNWVNKAGGILLDASRSVTTDSENNICITGEFEQAAIFDTINLTSQNFDLFVAKYNESGELIWVQQATSSNDLFSRTIATDSKNNVYIAGNFLDSLFIGDTIATSTINIKTAFLAKYNSNGQFLWVRTAFSNSFATAYSIAVNANDEIYVDGMFEDSLTFSNNITLYNLPFVHSVFVAKFDDLGNLIGARKIAGLDCVHSSFIYVDNYNNYYINGLVFDNANIGNITIYNTNGLNFIAKYDNNDNFVWVKQMQGTFINSISTDNDTNIYLSGTFYGLATIGNQNIVSNGNSDMFIAKYTPSGNFVWAKQAGSHNDDDCLTMCKAINNEFYIGGTFNGTAFFDNDSVVSVGGNDMFIAKFDSSGSFFFAKSFGSVNNDYCYSSAFSNSEKLYATGTFNNILFWENDSLTGYGSDDIFLTQMNDVLVNNSLQNYNTDCIVFPNPTNNFINIIFHNVNYNVTLQLIDLYGKVIYQIAIILNSNCTYKQIDLSSLQKGIYVLKISSKKGIVSKKVIKN